MSELRIGDQDAVYFEHRAPSEASGCTFVFVNALTGSAASWEAEVGPDLRERGHGTLSYNFRGQDLSPFAADTELTQDVIVGDLMRLLEAEAPRKPVLVGLSIGGIYAAHAVLQGAAVSGLVLLNTLREIGPRIAWVNDAMAAFAAVGGTALFLDAMFPLLVNPDFAKQARGNFLKGGYTPLDPAHGHMNLIRNSVETQWDIPYEDLSLPTLVVTGHQDRVFLDPDVVDRLYERLPNAVREEWHEAGHLLPQEAPAALVESLDRFARQKIQEIRR